MTAQQAGTSMQKIGKCLVQIGRDLPFGPDPVLEGDVAVGAAAFLCYLRDCITGSPKGIWSREELLVLLETMSRDREMFPCGIGNVLWALDPVQDVEN